MKCRSCGDTRLDRVLRKKELTFALCRRCGLFQLMRTSTQEVDINEMLATIAQTIQPDTAIEGLYLPSIIRNKRHDLLTIDTPFYFTMLSLQRALLRHRLEIAAADVLDNTFRALLKPVSGLRKMRLDEMEMGVENRNTYLLFALKLRE
jgi:hypothetical protein